MNCENLVDIKCLQGSKQRVLTDSLWTEKFRWEKMKKNVMILDAGRLYYVLLLLIEL